jgi:hypothetical protein
MPNDDMPDHLEERVRLIGAFTRAGVPLLVLNAVFILVTTKGFGSAALVPFAGSTLVGLVLLIRLQRTSLSRNQAAWHGVASLLLLLTPFITVVWAWQSPRQLLMGW